MSNHTWDCPHGFEHGQGCCERCPHCENAALEESSRMSAARAAFFRWEKTGDWHDLLAGIAEIARRARELEAS